MSNHIKGLEAIVKKSDLPKEVIRRALKNKTLKGRKLGNYWYCLKEDLKEFKDKSIREEL